MVLSPGLEPEVFAVSERHVNQLHHESKMDSNALAVIYLYTGLRCYPEIKTSWFCFLFSIDSRIDFSFCCNQLGAHGRIRTACHLAKHSVFQLLFSRCVYPLTPLRAKYWLGAYLLFYVYKSKKTVFIISEFCFLVFAESNHGCGGRIWTCVLNVMSVAR